MAKCVHAFNTISYHFGQCLDIFYEGFEWLLYMNYVYEDLLAFYSFALGSTFPSLHLECLNMWECEWGHYCFISSRLCVKCPSQNNLISESCAAALVWPNFLPSIPATQTLLRAIFLTRQILHWVSFYSIDWSPSGSWALILAAECLLLAKVSRSAGSHYCPALLPPSLTPPHYYLTSSHMWRIMRSVKNILTFHEMPDLNADKNVKILSRSETWMNWG